MKKRSEELISSLVIPVFTIIFILIYMIWEGDREVIRDLILIIGGVALLWRAESHDKIAKATLQSSEQTIFKDNFEFLTHPSESIRIGGIHNLHELAIQSPKRSKAVLEIFSAHLRSKTKEKDYQKDYADKPSEEISLLLDLLVSKESKLRKAYEEENSGEKYILNFQGAFLNGAYCNDAWLKGANLGRVRMQGTWLSGAQMQGALLPYAQMQYAFLTKAQMQGAYLASAQMQGASLAFAQMQGATLLSAKLHGANLEAACLQVAALGDKAIEKSQGGVLKSAQLQGAILENVQFQGADLHNVILRGASGRYSEELEHIKFVERMNMRRGKDTDLSGKVVFSGGLGQKDKQNIMPMLQQAEQYVLPAILEWFKHRQKVLNDLDVGTEANYAIPSEVVVGILPGKEVNQIIEECQTAMALQPEDSADSD